MAEIFKLDHTILQNLCQKAVLVSLYELKHSENPCLKPVSFSIYRDTGLKKPVSKTRARFHKWSHRICASSISRSDLLVVDAKMEAQETKLYNTLHH